MKALFPDNKKGAKNYLHKETNIPSNIINSAKYEADPYVSGCWRATFKGYHCKYCIIYNLGSDDINDYDSELGD